MSPVTGGCMCGGVRFEIDGDVGPAGYCHCTRCQRRTGTAASAQARFPAEGLVIEHGADLVRWWDPESGFGKAFCARCGSALFSRSPDRSAMSVRLGALDPGHGLRPSFRQHVGSATEWEALPGDGLDRFEGSRPA